MELRRVSRCVTKQQFETLISIMEQNKYFAENKICKEFTKHDRKRMWEEIAQTLNSLGGAVKTVEKWAKCWSDKKNDTRKKANKILANSINGVPQTEEKLSEIDERVLVLTAYTIGSIDKNSEESSMEGTYNSVAEDEVHMNNSYITPNFVTSLPVVASVSTNPTTSVLAPSNQLVSASSGVILPTINEDPPITLTSEDVPSLIKVEMPEEEEEKGQFEEALPSATYSPPSATYSPPAATYSPPAAIYSPPDEVQPPSPQPQPSPPGHIGLRHINPRKQRNRCCRSKFMTAERAAESFVSISERNCAVLERIASAMETQAAESAKQTQLMLELVEVLKKR